MKKMLFVFVVLLVMMVSVHGQQETFKIEVYKGWNLISFPVDNIAHVDMGDVKLYTVSPNLNSKKSAQKYELVKQDEIEAGTGYWAFSSKDTVITFSGAPLNSIKLSLRKGQSAYIGGPNCEVETKLRLYYYDSSSNRYVETNKMEPGIGYYVKPEDDGEVLLTCSEEEEECVDLNDPSTWVDSDDPSHPYIREVHASDMDGYMVMKSLTLCPYEYNIESDGLIITQNNVNLDCNNATLIGDGDWTLSKPDKGIFGYRNPWAGGLQNVTIKNCNIENFADGIIIIAGHNITINNTLINNSFYSGIEISQSGYVTVANTEIVNASEQFGIFIHDSNHVSISNSSSHDSYSGVSIQNSVYSMILNSSFNNNRMYGIHLRPHGHAITNVTACNNGLDVQEPGDTIITNLQCDTSSPDGICDIPCCTLNPDGYSFSEIGEEKDICGLNVTFIDVDVLEKPDCNHVFYFNVSTPTESRIIGLSETGGDSDTVGGYYFTLVDGNVDINYCLGHYSANATLQVTEGSGEVFSCYANGYTFVPLGAETCNSGDCATLVGISFDYDSYDHSILKSIFLDDSGQYHALGLYDTDTVGSSKLTVCKSWYGYFLNVKGAWVKWTTEPDTVDDCVGYDTFGLGDSQTIGSYTFTFTDVTRDNCDDKPLCYYANINIYGPGVNENLKLKEHGSITWNSPDGHYYNLSACDIQHDYELYARYAKLKIEEVGTPGEERCEGYTFSRLLDPSTGSLYSPYPEYRILFNFGTKNIDPDDPTKFIMPALFYVIDSDDNIVKIVKVFPGHPVVWNSPYGPIRFDVCELFYGNELYDRWIRYNISTGTDGETYCDYYNLVILGDTADISGEVMTLNCTYPKGQNIECYNRYAHFTSSTGTETLNLSSPDVCDIGVPLEMMPIQGYVYYGPEYHCNVINETTDLIMTHPNIENVSGVMHLGEHIPLGYNYGLKLADIGASEPCPDDPTETCHAALFDVIDYSSGSSTLEEFLVYPGECYDWDPPVGSNRRYICVNRTVFGFELFQRWADVNVSFAHPVSELQWLAHENQMLTINRTYNITVQRISETLSVPPGPCDECTVTSEDVILKFVLPGHSGTEPDTFIWTGTEGDSTVVVGATITVDSIDETLTPAVPCCDHDGVCESAQGETTETCPDDCSGLLRTTPATGNMN